MADGAPPSSFDGLARLYGAAPAALAFRKLRKRILRRAQEAISRYAMIEPGARPRWLVCVSGGKDSHALLLALMDLQWQGALAADLLACNLDQGQPGFPKDVLPEYLGALGVPFRVETRDTYAVVKEKIPEGATYCSLCSRLRRGNLYRIAREEGCSAVVLGHHADDALATFFLNFFHGGRLAAMAANVMNEAGDLRVLRPLILCAEEDLAAYARAMRVPIIPCDLCGSQDGLKRAEMKEMIAAWERDHPGRRKIMLRALQNVEPAHLLDAKAAQRRGGRDA